MFKSIVMASVVGLSVKSVNLGLDLGAGSSSSGSGSRRHHYATAHHGTDYHLQGSDLTMLYQEEEKKSYKRHKSGSSSSGSMSGS